MRKVRQVRVMVTERERCGHVEVRKAMLQEIREEQVRLTDVLAGMQRTHNALGSTYPDRVFEHRECHIASLDHL